MRWMPVVMIALVAVLAGTGASAASMRCGDDLVKPGDSTFEVLSRCGEPLSRDIVAVESTGLESDSDFDRNSTLSLRTEKVELWVYDRGPGTLLQILRFSGGELVSIESGGRSDSPAIGKSRAQVDVGDTRAEVLQAWGEPLYKEDLGIDSTEARKSLPDSDAKKLTATSEKLERWIYEFGSGEFRRHVIFRAGRVMRVELGERP